MTPETANRVLIWGAGAIGGTIGAFLARAGRDVTLVDVSVDHVAAMRDRGLSISGNVPHFTMPVVAHTPDSLEGEWPLIFLAVKGQFTEAALHQLKPHLAPRGGVLSLQNGLTGDVVARVIGGEGSYTALVDIAADMIAPGSIRFGFSHPMAIGPVAESGGVLLDDMVEMMRSFDPVAFGTRDIQAFVWGKNVFSTLTCCTAVAVSPMAALLVRDDLEPLWRQLTGEVMAVARAIGVVPRGTAPFDPAVFAPGAPAAGGRAYFDQLAAVASSGKPHSGMWRDLAIHHRQTEVDALMTPICELGARHGAPCPGLAAMVAMILEIERGQRAQNDNNLVVLLESVS